MGLQMLIRLANRKRLLEGDLNILQEKALSWLIIDELDQQTSIEKERMKYTLLAGNPQLYETLYNQDEDEIPDENIEWMVPESIEEAESILKILEGIQLRDGESGV